MRARLGKMAAFEMPASQKSAAEVQRDEEQSKKLGLLNPSLYASSGRAVPRSEITTVRVDLLKQQSKALSRRTRRGTVRAGSVTHGDALAMLRDEHYFDTLNSQTWSHISALVPPEMVRPLQSVNTAMRDLLNGWAALLNFDEGTLKAALASRQVVPGVHESTSYIGSDHIISLKTGPEGPRFQVYRFRPVVEPRFESPPLGANGPKFGAQLRSDGTYISVRGKSSADAGKPVQFNVFAIERRGKEGRIHSIPHLTNIVSTGIRGVVELVHREQLYVAFHDRDSKAYVVEVYDCPTGKLLKRASQPSEFGNGKVVKLIVEARHLYLLTIDAKDEMPYFLISFTLELTFESAFALDAQWDQQIFFCKHRAAFYDAKKHMIREIAMDIQRGETRLAASYVFKLKRKTEIRHILMDSTRLVVINTANTATIYARSTQKMHRQFDMPGECIAMYPLQSHLVIITPSDAGHAGPMKTGLISPRGGPNVSAANVVTQAEVYNFKQ